ncbi:MAG TPA: RtcB family protein [Longimicrobiales bacterium]|nr:RtcB family protein [Longimicrobiales bacterium]
MTPEAGLAPLHEWTCGPMPRGVETVLQRLRRSEGIDHVAVMPDVHLSGDFCVGTVVASRHRVYPGAVGGDIGCGMVAARFEAGAHDVLGADAGARRILRALRTMVPVNRHGRRTVPSELPHAVESLELSVESLSRRSRRDGLAQLGTLGRGNHFLELQSDDEGALWLMVHSGSRGMGRAVAAHHARRCEAEPGGLGFFDAVSDAGRAYLADVAWCTAYARANRIEMVEAVAALMSELFAVELDETSIVHCDHNHVRRERHRDVELWVHRKGAVSAAEGEPGIIPGSMGSPSFHTEGRGCTAALRSSSHGAGRLMSRTEARERVSTRELRRQMRGVRFDEERAGRLRDEAPSAYRDIGEVMRAQKELTRVVRRVRPLLAYKG